MRRALIFIATFLLTAAALAAPNFDRDIAPLLVRRCLDCHSGSEPKAKLDLSKAKSARRVIIDKLDGAFWQRVSDGDMPPKKPLPEAEKKLLREWIEAGAKWGTDPIDPFRATTDARAGYDWWALQPVARPAPPQVSDAGWSLNAIDRFIFAKLEAKKLLPSPPVDRRAYIRRVTFDLTGLPPSPEEVEAFINDTSPEAYERLVDRLLSSPAYGERWARHWLDVVRFGESDGFERDLPRFNAWPYRDWVMNALNAGMPYDEFVRMQLAGDVLKPGDRAAVAAVGFLVAGPHDIVVPVSENMKQGMRQDELEDIVGTVGQTFLGLTVHCARCHDHKFDPVSQKDYYSLVSALAGVGFGERSLPNEPARALLAKLREQESALLAQITAIEEPIRRELITMKQKNAVPGPKPIADWDFTQSLDDRVGQLHGKLHGSAKRDNTGVKLDGKSGYVATASVAKSLRAKTLEAWVRLDSLTQAGGGVMTVQTMDGHTFDSIVFAEQQKSRWLAGSNFFRRTRSFEGSDEVDAAKQFVHVAITYSDDGTITGYRDGRPYGKPYKADGVQEFAAGKAQVVFGMRHGPAGGNKMLAGTIQKARLYDKALSADEVSGSAGQPVVTREELVARLKGAAREKYLELLREQSHLQALRGETEGMLNRKVYSVIATQPATTHVLARGAVTAKREVVSAEIPAALASRLQETKLTSDAPEANRRRGLATWITDAKNPLFARVMVNRLWHYHFGTGLVETTSDFGFNGSRPSHPELLDWLADEFVRQDFSLKAMHRLMVTSATYRQSSLPRRDAMALDAENRLLWRKSPSRLEAEAVRDAILFASGQLDRRMGGEPYLDFKTYFFKGTQFYDPLETMPPVGRRSLYRMWARGGRSPLLDTLDCPDPSTTTPRRARTTTPLQALALFNNAFVLDQAEHFAERVRREAGGDVVKQVERAYAIAYGRAPTERELAVVRRFVAEHGVEALGRVVFNTSEFVQVP